MPALASFPQAAVPPTAGPSFRGWGRGDSGAPRGRSAWQRGCSSFSRGKQERPSQPGGPGAMSGGAAGPRPRRWRRSLPSASRIPYPAPCPPHPPCAPCPPHPALPARPRRCSPRYPRLSRRSSAPGAHLESAPSAQPAFPIDRGGRLSPPRCCAGRGAAGARSDSAGRCVRPGHPPRRALLGGEPGPPRPPALLPAARPPR